MTERYVLAEPMLIVQISDTHIRREGKLAYHGVGTAAFFARAVEHICRLTPRPDVVLGTGDLVDAGRAEEYRHPESWIRSDRAATAARG